MQNLGALNAEARGQAAAQGQAGPQCRTRDSDRVRESQGIPTPSPVPQMNPTVSALVEQNANLVELLVQQHGLRGTATASPPNGAPNPLPNKPVMQGHFAFEEEEPAPISAQLPSHSYGFSVWDPFPPQARGGEGGTQIRPVGLDGTANLAMGLPWVGDPLKMQLLRNLATPVFQGTNEHFPKFKFEWDRYLAKLDTGRPVTDAEKLQLLENCLDETNKRELQYIIKAANGRPIVFSEFWAKLTDRYGEDVYGCARRRWRELNLPTAGRVTLNEWRDFKIKFLDIWHDIPGARHTKC